MMRFRLFLKDNCVIKAFKHTGICLTEWPKKRKVSQNHKTHFIPVFIS